MLKSRKDAAPSGAKTSESTMLLRRRRVPPITNSNKWVSKSVVAVLVSLVLSTVSGRQDQGDSSRQIVLEEFTKARPSSGSTRKGTTPKQATAVNAATDPKPSRYKRVTRPLAKRAKDARLPDTEIGITIWRLRPSRPEDEAGARLLVMQNDQSSQWTPERIEARTDLNVGDRVRISIEAPRSGYLYVVDREEYADGSLGDAYMIFPTKRTRGGDNRVRPGKLIDIPAQEDQPSFFTLVPSPSRKDQVGESLSIILTTQPLSQLPITDKPLLVSKPDLLEWQTLWGSTYEQYEMEGGAGLAWTREEREAGSASSARYLTQTEPAPQTVYRLAGGGKSLLITVRLNYRNQ